MKNSSVPAGVNEKSSPSTFTPVSYTHLDVYKRQMLHYANTPEYPQKCTDYVISLILVELMIPRDAETGHEPVSSEIREWIKMHYDKKITLDDISKQFGYNKDLSLIHI